MAPVSRPYLPHLKEATPEGTYVYGEPDESGEWAAGHLRCVLCEREFVAVWPTNMDGWVCPSRMCGYTNYRGTFEIGPPDDEEMPV